MPFHPTLTLSGHSEAVYAVAFGPANTFVVTGSFDKTLKIWDAKSGKETKTLTGHQGLVLAVSVTPDGSHVTSGGADNKAKVWNSKTGKSIRDLNHPELVDAVAYDPVGKRLATGCHDGQLRIWDLAVKDGQPKTIAAHRTPKPAAIYSVAWSPDGKTVATASFDQTVRLWDAGKGTLVRELPAGFDRIIVHGKVGKVVPTLIGTAAGWYASAPPDPGHRDQVFCVTFDAAGKMIATSSSDRTLKLWTVLGDPVRTFVHPGRKDGTSHPGHVIACHFTPDGKTLVSAGPAPKSTGIVCIWSVADGKLVNQIDVPLGPVLGMAISPDGSSLLLGCGPKARGGSAGLAVVLPLPK